jgi:hypothetical protein
MGILIFSKYNKILIWYWITKLRSLPNSKSICGGNDEGDHKTVCPVCGEEGGRTPPHVRQKGVAAMRE